MIDAFILCDFDNPLSMRYLDLSLKSFEPVKDIVNITPLQCDTPATTPIYHKGYKYPFSEEDRKHLPSWLEVDDPKEVLLPRHIGGCFYDPPAYGAIAYSQLKLIKRIAEGENIAIMEHDAALINEKTFREMIDEYWGEVDLFMPGTCMEFYGMSQRLAKATYDHMYNLPEYTGEHYSGIYGVLSAKYEQYFPAADLFMVPSKAHETVDKVFVNNNIRSCELAVGFDEYEPACKQFMFRDKDNNNLNTNADKYNNGMGIWEHIGIKGGVSYDRCFVFIDE